MARTQLAAAACSGAPAECTELYHNTENTHHIVVHHRQCHTENRASLQRKCMQVQSVHEEHQISNVTFTDKSSNGFVYIFLFYSLNSFVSLQYISARQQRLWCCSNYNKICSVRSFTLTQHTAQSILLFFISNICLFYFLFMRDVWLWVWGCRKPAQQPSVQCKMENGRMAKRKTLTAVRFSFVDEMKTRTPHEKRMRIFQSILYAASNHLTNVCSLHRQISNVEGCILAHPIGCQWLRSTDCLKGGNYLLRSDNCGSGGWCQRSQATHKTHRLIRWLRPLGMHFH